MYFCTKNENIPNPLIGRNIFGEWKIQFIDFLEILKEQVPILECELCLPEKKWIFKIGNYLTISPLNRLSHVSKYIGGAF